MPAQESAPAPPVPGPTAEPARSVAAEPGSAAPMTAVPSRSETAAKRSRTGWSAADMMVMAAAIGVLALSIAGLVWLLRSY